MTVIRKKESLPLTLIVILNKNAPFIGGQYEEKYSLTLLVIGKKCPLRLVLSGKKKAPLH